MERIAPLAKILAEANGIDWQALRGSGEGGMVVEQDILNYLSRIMSGEEEPPSTPVDLPPADWNGDVNAMPDLSGLSAEQLSRAGVDSDLAALLNHSGLDQPVPGAAQQELHVSPQVPATPAVTDLDADDMEFELDDDQAEPAAAVAAVPAAESAAPAAPSLGNWEWTTPAAQVEAPASVPDLAPPIVQLPEIQLPDAASAALSSSFQAPALEATAAPLAAVARPEIHLSDVAVPDVAVPDVAVPNVAVPNVPNVAVPDVALPDITLPATGVPTSAALSAPVGEASVGGLGSLLSRLYQQAPAPAASAEPAPQVSAEQATPPFSLDSMDTDLSSAALAVNEPVAPAVAPVVGSAADQPAPTPHDVSSVASAPVVEASSDAPPASSFDWSAALRGAPQPAAESVQAGPVQPEPIQVEPIQPEPVQPEPVQPEPVQPEPVQPEPVQVAEAHAAAPAESLVAEPELAASEQAISELPATELPVTELPVTEHGQAEPPAEAQPQPEATPEPTAAPVAASAEADAAPAVAPLAPTLPAVPAVAAPHGTPAEDAVWFGTYLRRSVDLGPASDLRDQLTSALGQDVPLAFLVARAAQRHAGALGLGSLALHDSAGGRARSVAGEHLRGALGALAYDYEGTPELLVVDAGALELDELHYPHTVTLSMGRLQHGRAALTLNGDVDAVQGARFLADLDDTLNRPIMLML